MLPQSIDTDRLILDRLHADDAAFIFELVNTPGWKKWIGERNVNTLSDAEQYIVRINDSPTVTYWVAKLKSDSTTKTRIGVVTLIQRDYLDQPDIGFAYLPQFQGMGYALEGVKALLAHLLRQQQQEDAACTIYAVVLPDNVKSVKLLERLRFCFVRPIEALGEALSLHQADRSVLDE